MDSDNYIDRLSVFLEMPSTLPPPAVQEAADAIVDEQVVPAVESVLEEMGKERDESIPLVEIDVGRVRRQDLRDAIESSLKNALDRFALSGNSFSPSPLDDLQEYAQSGEVPLESAGAPFHPSLFVTRVLTEDADAIRERIGSFSERELAGLLLALQPVDFREEASPVVRLRTEILARLTRDYPETASILLARLASWRNSRSHSGPLSASRLDITEAAGGGDRLPPDTQSDAGNGETGRKAAGETRPERVEEIVPEGYEEIGPADIPAGVSVLVAGPALVSVREAPDYVMTPETPARYFRKVSMGTSTYPVGAAPVQDVGSRSPSDSQSVSRLDIAEAAGDGDRLSQESPSDTGKVETGRKAAGETRPEGVEKTVPEGYEEIVLQDIPASVSVVVAGPALAFGQEMPDYVMTPETPARYFRKVSQGTSSYPLGAAPDQGSGTGSRSHSGALSGSVLDTAEAAGEGDRLFPEAPSDAGKEGTVRKVVGEITVPEGYEEIVPQDIPAGVSVVVAGPVLAAGQETPDYVMTPEMPARYFRKQGEGGEPRPEMEESIWEVQDFERGREEGRIPVSDAGLVLVHPFIHRFLENLGLVNKGEFVSELARIRAVHLLRDLTGSDEPHYHHNLLLEKILCGLPPGYAIPPEWEPDDVEKEEEEGLLKAVCEYWRPLSGSSVSALCEGFIRRPGSIERFEDSWDIRVEGKTIDILLDDLPWELSLIHLPWLKKPMAVEWQREQYD